MDASAAANLPLQRRLAMLAGLLLACLAPLLSAQPLSFDQAWQQLEARNQTLAAAFAAEQRAAAQADEARGHYWPEVIVDARATYMDAPLAVDLDPVRRVLAALAPQLPDNLLPRSYQLQKRQFSNLAVSATWPVYTGGRVSAGVDAAQAGHVAAGAQRQASLDALRLELVRRYFGQRLAQHALQVHQATAASLRAHHADALALQREGQSARAETLRAGVALAEAERDVETARLDLQLTRAGLATLLAADAPVETVTSLPGLDQVPPLAQMQQRAVAENPQLLAARAQHQRAQAGRRAARGERKPTVALFATRELYTNDLTLLDPDWAVGIAMTWPLFDGGRRSSAVAAALAQTDEVGARLAAAERDIRLLVEQGYQQLATARARIASLRATDELARESLRAQQLAFGEGFSTSRDVVDAQLALSRVQLGLLAARYEGVLALAAVHQASGNGMALRSMISAADTARGDDTGEGQR